MKEFEDVYYVPDIEEFCVGFRYELEDLAVDLVNREFRPVTFDVGDRLIILLEDYIPNRLVRAKHLSKQDIIGLGWTYKRTRFHSSMIFRGFVDERGCDIKIMFNVTSNWLIVYNENDSCRFSGTIRNKNEFKKLIKQLKIHKHE